MGCQRRARDLILHISAVISNRVKWHITQHLEKSLFMFPLRINGPHTKVKKLRMKPNLGGLDVKTTRQTCNTVSKERGQVLKSLSARTITFTMKKPGHVLY